MEYSLVVVARDESANIKACLDTVHNSAEKIVVVDDRTADDTAEIAQSCGALVEKVTFTDYSQIKNTAISKAKFPWVLLLDADERPSRELLDQIGLLEESKDIDGYMIAFRNYLGGVWLRHGGMYPDWHIRFFRSTSRYVGVVHERLSLNPEKVGKITGDIIHYTYKDAAQLFNKVRRYAILEGRGVKKSWLAAIYYMSKRWIGVYILRAGYLDGYAGLTNATALAYYQYLKYIPS